MTARQSRSTRGTRPRALCQITTYAMLIVIGATLLSGCSAGPNGPYTTPDEAARDPREADRLNAQAMEMFDDDPDKVERLLRRALAADLYCGPAHNNLGVLYLKQGRLYEAANEFEFARKLLPGLPEPRLNLALTLQRAGRTDEAIRACDAALEVYPGHIGALQAKTKMQLRSGQGDEKEIAEALREIAMRGDNERWREWALIRLSVIGD